MRIAHFLVGRCNPDSANGVDKTVYYLSKSQALLGHSVGVFSLTSKSPIAISGVAVNAYRPAKLPFMLPRRLLTELLAWKPEVVHLHSVYTPPNTALTAWLRRRGIPYVITPHGGLSPYVLRRRWYLKMPYKFFLERPAMNRATFIHAIGDEETIRSYGIRAPIVMAPNGLDVSSIPSHCDNGILASRFPQVRGKRVFLFLGRLDPLHKGLDLLLEGFARSGAGNAVLVLVGPSWRGSFDLLKKLAHTLNIETAVIFTGPAYDKEKFDLLAGADVFIHTSRWEGLPFAVLEAASMGIPCMVTAVADPFKMLSSYRAGIVVGASAESISNGLQQCAELSDTDLQTMGGRARMMIEREFNWVDIAEKVSESYRSHITYIGHIYSHN